MTPGTVLLDTQFEFANGQTGQKYLVILNDGSCGLYIAVKTTSQDRHYTYTPGCQMGYLACFHMPAGWCCFVRDTWIQLEDFFPIAPADVLQRQLPRPTSFFSNRIWSTGGGSPGPVVNSITLSRRLKHFELTYKSILRN